MLPFCGSRFPIVGCRHWKKIARMCFLIASHDKIVQGDWNYVLISAFFMLTRCGDIVLGVVRGKLAHSLYNALYVSKNRIQYIHVFIGSFIYTNMAYDSLIWKCVILGQEVWWYLVYINKCFKWVHLLNNNTNQKRVKKMKRKQKETKLWKARKKRMKRESLRRSLRERYHRRVRQNKAKIDNWRNV